jgi:hypothetical protein
VIFFVVPEDGRFGIGEYLETYGEPLLGRVKILAYEEIAVRKGLSLGSYIFSAIDQLFSTEAEIAEQCWRALARAGAEVTLINHPAEVLRRYDLLRACFELRRNSFRVRRASDFLGCDRFPVFLRHEREHNGSLSGLLYTRQALTRALVKALLRGYRLQDMIIVEYCETANPVGIFQKYAAFIVGNTIIRHTLIHSRDWVTKSGGRLVDPEKAREEFEYVNGNAHSEWLRETFDLAKIGYGRIDYGLREGVPQVWEINTNPTIVRRIGKKSAMTEEQRKLRAPVRERFYPQFQAALEAIDVAADPCRTIRIEVSRSQLQRLEAEKELRLRIQARKTGISTVAQLPIRLLRRLRTS